MMHEKLGEGMRNEKNKLVREIGQKGKSRGKGGCINQAKILTTQGSEKTSVWLLHEGHGYGEA